MDQMDKSSLLVLHNYNDYANQLVLDTASRMTEAELIKESSPSHGNVKTLLLHIVLCEYGFILRCLGTPPESVTDDFDNYSFEEIRELYARVAGMRKDYLEIVNENELNEIIPTVIGKHQLALPRWQMLAQSLVHSTHHRGELSIVLTALGYPLPTLDILLEFIKESGQQWS